MVKLLLAMSMLASFAAAATPAWRWVDADGVVHYSDRPVEGAEVIQLPDRQGTRPTVSARPAPGAASPAAQAEPAQPYTRFDIVSPAQQETLWNIGGNLTVEIALAPNLRPGNRLDVILDGEPQSLNTTSTTVTLTDVYRGVHTVEAVILDDAGNEVLRSLPVQVMVQQTSILNPNNPNRPNRPTPPANTGQ